MRDGLGTSISVAASGLQAQAERMRVVSENLANVQSTGSTAGADPYARKVIGFSQFLDAADGTARVKVNHIVPDNSSFRVEHEPGHPAADENGFVRYPNVNSIVEVADMREAARSYEANLQVMRQARDLISATIDLLRSGR